MLKYLIALAALFTIIAPSVSNAAALPSGKMKATWLWNTLLISSADSRNEVLQFAAQQHVARIYLQVNPDVAQSEYRAFIKSAAEAGVQIHALDGAPDWIHPDQRHRVTDTVNWVKSYNSASAVEERFSGIQFDIEPYVLPEWNTQRAETVQSWLDTITLFADEVRRDSDLTVNAALPFWLDEITLADNGGTLIEAIMNLLDEVTLMSYRDTAEALAEITASKLKLGDRLGKKVFVAVETNPTSEPSYITFYEEGKAAMAGQLSLIDELLNGYSSYAGIAVHDYAGWRKLKE